MNDADTLLQAAAINALYSGKVPLCRCGAGAVRTDDWGDLYCDACPGQGPNVTALRMAHVVRRLNALARLQ